MSRQTPAIFSKSLYSTLTPLSNRLQPDPASTSRSSKYRYASVNRNQNVQQVHVSSALSKQYRSQLKTALPEIRQDKVQLLQEWLNDALQGDIPQDGRCRQPLKMLKSYELDKASLRNQNISHEQINKLYNSLFVYSNGIKNAFEQMFTMISGMQTENNKFQKVYWQVFIKLLESTIPVKTCFQITEQTYIREIAEMKKKISLKDRAFDGERQGYEGTIRKLKKEIEEANYRFKQFENDYNIMKATLQMTELTFNDEVSLRLKFEQKINQVYSSYEELQQKYEKLRAQLNDKKQSLIEATDDKKQLRERMNEQIIRNNDLMERLQRLENDMRDLREQLEVKNQQILDIQLENSTVEEKKVKEEYALEQLLVTIRLLRKNQSQHNARVEQMQGLVREQQANIEKLKASLTAAREKNDELYVRCHEAQTKILPIQQENAKQSMQIDELKDQLSVCYLKNKELEQYKKEVDQKCHLLQIGIQNNRKELVSNQQLLVKYAGNVSEMKEAKDRMERLNSQLRLEMQNQRANYNEKVQGLGQAQIRIFEMKVEIEKIKQKNKILQNQLINQQEISDMKLLQIRQKDSTHNEQLIQKQRTIKKYELELQSCRKQIGQIQQISSRKDAEKIRKLQQITYLRKINAVLEQDLKSKKQIIADKEHELELKVNEIHNLTKQLERRQYATEKKSNDIDSEKKSLRAVIAQQQRRIQQRREYVHPMLVEDLVEQLTRFTYWIKQIEEKSKYATEKFDQVVEQLRTAKNQIEVKNQQIKQDLNMKEALNSQLIKLREQMKLIVKQYQLKLDEKQQLIRSLKTQQKDKIDRISSEIESYQSKLKTAQMTIAYLQAQISSIKNKQKPKSVQIQRTDAAIQAQEQPSLPSSQAVILQSSGEVPYMATSSVMKRSVRPHQQLPAEKSRRVAQKLCESIADEGVQQKSISQFPTPKIQQSQIQKQQNSISLQQRRQYPQQKKIEGREFKKALRLTFMRR